MNDPSREDSSEEPLSDAAAESPGDESIDSATEVEALAARMASLHQTGRSGANWFYWVAGLSLVNSVILLTGGTLVIGH